jgi:hypothetical protein
MRVGENAVDQVAPLLHLPPRAQHVHRAKLGPQGQPTAQLKMPQHKFAVGQKVRFIPETGQMATRARHSVIVRQLPEPGGLPKYETRSEVDGRARVVPKTVLLTFNRR